MVCEPYFCDWTSEDFTLCALSPAAGGAAGCGRLGAYDIGCQDCFGPIRVETTTWGALRLRYR